MVPLSVLESAQAALAAQRADANSAMAAQRADFNSALADLRAIMGKQDAAMGKQDAAMERERASAKEISAAHYKALQLAAAGEVAAARHDADIATGRVNARVLLEESLAVIWRTWEALEPAAKTASGVPTLPAMMNASGKCSFKWVIMRCTLSE